MSVCCDGSSEVSGKTSPQQRHPAHPAMSPKPSRSLHGDLRRVGTNFSKRRGVTWLWVCCFMLALRGARLIEICGW